MSSRVLNSVLAFAMACSVYSWFAMADFYIANVVFFHVPVLWVLFFIGSLFVAQDVRNAFKKVLWYDKREDRRPIYQVGVGMIFFIAQVGFVEVFMHSWMPQKLDGMPLYFVFAFMNAFLATVIFEEMFYKEKRAAVQVVKKRVK